MSTSARVGSMVSLGTVSDTARVASTLPTRHEGRCCRKSPTVGGRGGGAPPSDGESVAVELGSVLAAHSFQTPPRALRLAAVRRRALRRARSLIGRVSRAPYRESGRSCVSRPDERHTGGGGDADGASRGTTQISLVPDRRNTPCGRTLAALEGRPGGSRASDE